MAPRCQVLYQAFYGIITVNIFITSGSQNYTSIIMIFLKRQKKKEREREITYSKVHLGRNGKI